MGRGRTAIAIVAMMVAAGSCKKETGPPPGYLLTVTLVEGFNQRLIRGLEIILDSADGGASLNLAETPITDGNSLGLNFRSGTRQDDGDADREFVILFSRNVFTTSSFQFFLQGQDFTSPPFSIRVNVLGERGVIASGTTKQLPNGDPLVLGPNVRGSVVVAVPCVPDLSCESAGTNRPPVLAPVHNGDVVKIGIGRTLSFVLDAYDPDGDDLTYSVDAAQMDALPGDKSFAPDTRVFTFTPSNTGGPFDVTFTVSDGANSVNQTARLEAVTGNSSPFFNPVSSRVAIEGQRFVLPISASDPDPGDVLTYTLDPGDLPAGNNARFDAAAREFVWTPTFEDGRDDRAYTARITATDQQGASAVLTLLIWVADINRPPVIAAPSSLTVAVGSAATIGLLVSDDDNDSVTVSADLSGMPSGNTGTFTDSTRIFSWTPAEGDVRAEPWVARFTAVDARGGRTTASIGFTVHPTNSAPQFEPIAPQCKAEGQTVTFPVNATDSDSFTITMDAQLLPSGHGADFTNNVFTWTPAQGTARSTPYKVTFNALDSANQFSRLDVLITVASSPGECPGDGGVQDAGTADAGTADAGTPDAGTADAGTPDAGTVDAGTPDAGTPDAGTPDAGTPDGGAGCATHTDCGIGEYCNGDAVCSACSLTDPNFCGTNNSPPGCERCEGGAPECNSGVCGCSNNNDCGSDERCQTVAGRNVCIICASWNYTQPVNQNLPGAVAQHTAIYDELNHRMVTFGGVDAAAQNTGQTFVLVLPEMGTAMTWVTPTVTGNMGIEPRRAHAAVYDPINQRMLVYGGTAATGVLSDTLEMSLPATGNLVWNRLNQGQVGNAGQLTLHDAVYDSFNGRMLMTGGNDQMGPRSDVWSLDVVMGTIWTQLMINPAGPGLQRHKSAYDPSGKAVWVWGGIGPDIDDDLFRLDLTMPGTPTWSRTVPASGYTWPDLRYGHTIVYDSSRGNLILFGGTVDGNTLLYDVWVLRLSSKNPRWEQQAPLQENPTMLGRYDHTAIYDPSHDRVIIYGGRRGGNFLSSVATLELGTTTCQ